MGPNRSRRHAIVKQPPEPHLSSRLLLLSIVFLNFLGLVILPRIKSITMRGRAKISTLFSTKSQNTV